MPTLNYKILKILRTNPKEYLTYNTETSNSNLAAILIFNEELFQDMFFTAVNAPENPAIADAFKTYANEINRFLKNHGEIYQETLDDMMFEIFQIPLDISPNAVKELFLTHEKYLSALLINNKKSIESTKLDQLTKYKKLLISHFPINQKLLKPSGEWFTSKKYYVTENKQMETYCLCEHHFNLPIPVGGNRKTVELVSDIDYMLINNKEKIITIKSIEIFDNLTNFRKVFNEERLDLRIGLNLLLLASRPELSKYMLNYKIVGCDLENCCVFTLSKYTIDRIKRVVIEDLSNAYLNISMGDYSIPGEYKKEFII